MDGTGKSTLAVALARTLDRAGIATTVEHRFRWFDGVMGTPWRVVRNRFVDRQAIIFNRCFVDNLARLYAGTAKGQRALRASNALWKTLSPRFDVILCLQVPFEEVQRRGRLIGEAEYIRLSTNYRALADMKYLVPIASDRSALAAALGAIHRAVQR
jgi:thymidylate kinase